MLPNFTQDELRMIEHMTKGYVAKKRRNINALIKRFGTQTDMKRIRNMDNSAVMALQVRAKARAMRLADYQRHHEKDTIDTK